MKRISALLLLITIGFGAAAHANDSRLGERVNRLEHLSESIARDTRRAGIYGSFYLDAENLARDARRLNQALQENQRGNYVDSRYRDLERRYQSFDRRYQRLNSRHHSGHLHRDYIEVGAIFGDIRVIIRESMFSDSHYYNALQPVIIHRFSPHYNNHTWRNASPQHGCNGKCSRKNDRAFRGGKHFDRDDKRRNHYRD
jgi:hypothetical protein